MNDTLVAIHDYYKRVGLSPHQRFRLVGVGLSNFCDPEDASAQPALFA